MYCSSSEHTLFVAYYKDIDLTTDGKSSRRVRRRRIAAHCRGICIHAAAAAADAADAERGPRLFNWKLSALNDRRCVL